MNSRQIVELSALVSAQAPAFVETTVELPLGATEDYWSKSRKRQTRWMLAFDQYRSLTSHRHGERYRVLWQRTHAMIEEVLCAEVLARVWGAAVAAWDQNRGEGRSEPLVRNVLTGHLEARGHALRLLVDGPRIAWQDAAELDALRRRAECWTDLLVAPLVLDHDVSEFAFDAERSADFAEAFATQSAGDQQPAAWAMLIPSLRLIFRRHEKPAPHSKANGRIASAIVRCFPEGVFPSPYSRCHAFTTERQS